jgi:hypothetical protein
MIFDHCLEAGTVDSPFVQSNSPNLSHIGQLSHDRNHVTFSSESSFPRFSSCDYSLLKSHRITVYAPQQRPSASWYSNHSRGDTRFMRDSSEALLLTMTTLPSRSNWAYWLQEANKFRDFGVDSSMWHAEVRSTGCVGSSMRRHGQWPPLPPTGRM